MQALGFHFSKDGTCVDDLIKKADIAMYKAKMLKSESAMVYHPGMDEDVQLQITMEQQLKQAIANEEFEVYFQPQINPVSGRLLGYEALARWQSPQLGNVSPSQFIPVAEESGLIVELGAIIAKKAISRHAMWLRQYPHSKLKLSLNVSPGQLMRTQFAEEFIDYIESAGSSCDGICIEVTESAAISDIQHTQNVLNKLTQAGIEVSLDDFGTGYSSLSLLKKLPLSWVKIDRSFISDIEMDSANRDIVHSILLLCHSLGYQTVVEGVETIGQLQEVENIGCDWVQGYFFSKPIPADKFESQFLSRTHELTKRSEAS